jgi:2-phospho-L-lactate guanylyltransferase (CobY/MobA/RfbA family)
VRPRVVPSPRFALDVDTPDDLRALLARGPATQTAVFLQKSGIARRLDAGNLLDADEEGRRPS